MKANEHLQKVKAVAVFNDATSFSAEKLVFHSLSRKQRETYETTCSRSSENSGKIQCHRGSKSILILLPLKRGKISGSKIYLES